MSKLIHIVLVLVVLISVILAGMYFLSPNKDFLNMLKLGKGGSTQPQLELYRRSSLTYTVKTIGKEQLTLTAESGELLLPNDPSVVKVYKGPDTSSPLLKIDDLKTGDSVNIDFIPGESALLYLN